MKKSKIFKKIISLVLVLATVLTFLPLNVIALDGGESSEKQTAVNNTETDAICDCNGVSVLHNGAAHKSIDLNDGAEEVLSLFVFGSKPTNISWQILTPSGDRWINIYGSNSEEISVSYALVGNMLNENNAAFIRAEIKHDGKTCISQPVEIKLIYDTGEVVTDEMTPGTFAMRSAVRAVADEDDEEEKFEIFSIVVNYIFDNGGIAFEPYGASVAGGSDFHELVKSPTVVGYKPVTRVGDSYVDAKEILLDYTNITSDITVNVIYEPDIVKYQVHHHLQDLYDDDFSIQPDYITQHIGLTASIVSGNLELTEDELPGFSPLAYERLEIAADGSTVIEIRYVRNYYLIDFDMSGGYGVEPLYIRYGSEVGANVPLRHGYLFDKWSLVSYGGETPTTEQASKYDINNGAIIITPNANLTFKANWITQLVKYTMVFWCENAEDDEFSYWGSLNELTAMSGSFVSGADRIREVGGIDDENCFTYMDALTDKNVLVEGDGSTIVNVYYSRNRYTISFWRV